MSKTLKRPASMFMALVMILAMVPVMSVTANAAAYTGNYDTLSQGAPTGDLTPLLNYPNLRVVNMSDNKIVGEVPNLSGLTKLEECYLNYNGSAGTLPALPDSIKFFQLACNNITGSIPESYIHLPNLERLNLVSNHLTGTIPAFGSDSTSLQQLMIGYTSVSGPIPESLCNLDSTPTTFLIALQGLTGLTGELPSGLAGKRVIVTDTKFDTNLGALSDKAKYTTGAWMEINKDVNGGGIADLNIDTANTPDSIPDLNIDVNGDGKADINIIVAGQVTILVPSFNQGTRIDADGMVLGWYMSSPVIKCKKPPGKKCRFLAVVGWKYATLKPVCK